MAEYTNTKYSYRNFKIEDLNNNLNTKVLFKNDSLHIYCSNYSYHSLTDENFHIECHEHNHETLETNAYLQTDTCLYHREFRSKINDIEIVNKLNQSKNKIKANQIIEFEAYNNLKTMLKNEVQQRLRHYFYSNEKSNSHQITQLKLNFLNDSLLTSNNYISATLIESNYIHPNGKAYAAYVENGSAIESSNLANENNKNLRSILNDINNDYNPHTGLQSKAFSVGETAKKSTHNNLLSCISSVYNLVQNIEHNININNASQLTTEINTEINNLDANKNSLMNSNVENIMINTLENIIKDCICYSDCVSFSYCQCYGYCGCNYSDERLKNSILYISDIKKEF